MHLLRQESLVCVFKSPQSVAPFNGTRTEETALYNLNEAFYVFVT